MSLRSMTLSPTFPGCAHDTTRAHQKSSVNHEIRQASTRSLVVLAAGAALGDVACIRRHSACLASNRAGIREQESPSLEDRKVMEESARRAERAEVAARRAPLHVDPGNTTLQACLSVSPYLEGS